MAFACPECGAETKVTDSRSKEGATRRTHVCKGDARHRFSTTEKADGWNLEEVAIRQSGDSKLQGGLFDVERLRDDVRAGVIGLVSEAQLRELVRGVVEQLRDELPNLAEPVTDEDWNASGLRKVAGATRPHVYIWDTAVRQIVDNQLRLSENRVPHVLYTIAFLGRTSGWRRAEDVLEWLFSENAYPDLREEIPSRPKVVTYRWRPTAPAPEPSHVRKAGRLIATTVDGDRVATGELEEQAGRLVEFNTKRFIASIERALLGRPNAIQTARSVAYWVLADLQGQERVHSSQLAVGVLDCLRRLDDIAYLRWATHIKQLPQVRNVKAEAIGLITHPSERLVFDQHASPVKRLAIHPAE